MKSFVVFALTLLAALFAQPALAARGSADFSRLVAIGDSVMAGFGANSLNERHQVFSPAALIARQVGYSLCAPNASAADNCFAQPLVSYPGLPAELQLLDLSGTVAPASGRGQPLMLTFQRPYNNLAVVGATVADLTSIDGSESATAPAALVLRGLGTQVEQALALRPTFVVAWIGGNDVLGAIAFGSPAFMTSVARFRSAYETMLDAFIAGAPNAAIVTGSLPSTPLVLPYLNLVPPFLVDPATRKPVAGPDGKPIFFIADVGGGKIEALAPGSRVLPTSVAKISSGFGIPEALKNVPPFNALPNVGKPLADADVLTPEEIAAIVTRLGEFNTVIGEVAAKRNIAVADIRRLFDDVSAQGIRVGPLTITNAYLTGGFFALDGVHLTDLGSLLFTNEFIRTINRTYETDIPVASVTQLFRTR